MTGNNELYLNHATVKVALEYYLNNVILKTPVKVTNIVSRVTDNVFVVSISPVVILDNGATDSVASITPSTMVGATKKVSNE